MRYLWPALFVVSVLALAFGPSLFRRDAHYDEDLTLISPHWEGIRSEFGRAFSERYFKDTGKRLRVVWLDVGGTSDARNYVQQRFGIGGSVSEAVAPSIGADIFFGGGMDILPGLADKKCLEPVPLPPELEKQIPAEVAGQILRDKANRYHAACLSSFGFVVNTTVLERAKLPAAETWEDLGRPEFHGWIACGDPTISGSLHQSIEIVLQSAGWEQGNATLGRMLSNMRAFNEGGPSVPRDVSLGQAAAGACIDFYATAPIRRQGAENLKLVVPKGAASVSPDGIALIRGAPNHKAAVAFVHFVMSAEGQKLWYQQRGTDGGPVEYDLERLPVMPAIYDSGAPTHTVVNPFKSGGDSKLDAKKGGTRYAMLNNYMRAVWVDTHEELFDARSAIIAAGRDADLGAELCAPLIGEKEIADLAQQLKDGKITQDQINAQRNTWGAMARRRYASFEKAAKTGATMPAR